MRVFHIRNARQKKKSCNLHTVRAILCVSPTEPRDVALRLERDVPDAGEHAHVDEQPCGLTSRAKRGRFEETWKTCEIMSICYQTFINCPFRFAKVFEKTLTKTKLVRFRQYWHRRRPCGRLVNSAPVQVPANTRTWSQTAAAWPRGPVALGCGPQKRSQYALNLMQIRGEKIGEARPCILMYW